MHEYFSNLKWNTYFSFIAIIVVAIICLFAVIIFHNKPESNDSNINSEQSVVNENINYES